MLQCAAFKKKNMRIYRVTTSVGRQFPSLQPQFPSEPCTFCQRLSAGIPKVQEANYEKSYLSSSSAWRYFKAHLFGTCKRLARSSHASEGELPVCLPSCEFAASAWAWAMPTRHRQHQRRRQKKSKATESERKPFQGPVANRDLQIRICVVLRPG